MKQKAVIILGMHRSGTSVLARGVKALGVELGNDLVPTQTDNPFGYWENQVVLRINETLLDLLSLKWDSLALIQSEHWQEPAIKNLKLEAVKLLRDSFGDIPLWGFKDPRAIRLLPFWLDVFQQLKLDEHYVLAIRNPLSVADSLLKRNRITQEKAHLMWLVHMIPYLLHIKKKPLVVVDYDLLLADPVQQLQRIVDRLHLPVDMASIHTNLSEYATDFVKKELCHCQYTKQDINLDAHIDLISKNAYHLLLQLAEDDIDSSFPEFWSEWEHLWKLFSSLKPVYHYIDQLEADSDKLYAQLYKSEAQIGDLKNQLKNTNVLYAIMSWHITTHLRATKRIVLSAIETIGLHIKTVTSNLLPSQENQNVYMLLCKIYQRLPLSPRSALFLKNKFFSFFPRLRSFEKE